MKMKNFNLGITALFAASALFFTSCKKETNVVPEPDVEFESSVDAAYANSLATEIDITAGYVGENQYLSSFFATNSGSTKTITVVPDTLNKRYIVTYNQAQCTDGKYRDGQVVFNYSLSVGPNNPRYYRSENIKYQVTFSNFQVDSFKIVNSTNMPLTIQNITPINYNPTTTNLTWTIEGKLKMKRVSDSTKFMTWEGKLTKVLKNTNEAAVFNPGKLAPINWAVYNNTVNIGAMVEYSGTISGLVSSSTTYKMEIKDGKAFARNFKCAPDKVFTIATTPSIAVVPSEWHPFVKGEATLTIGGKEEPRTLELGDDTAPCDNSGLVSVKGISYQVNFKK
jgi:hypothetical protein